MYKYADILKTHGPKRFPRKLKKHLKKGDCFRRWGPDSPPYSRGEMVGLYFHFQRLRF